MQWLVIFTLRSLHSRADADNFLLRLKLTEAMLNGFVYAALIELAMVLVALQQALQTSDAAPSMCWTR